MSERFDHAVARVDELARKRNRWASFTEAELCALDMATDQSDLPHLTLVSLKSQIASELKRRTAGEYP